MSAYEADVHRSTDEDDYSNQAIVVACNIEHIATILHIVCRWERPLQLCMVFPLRSFHDFYPLVQWLSGLSMRLHEVI